MIVAEIMEHLTTMVTGASAYSRTPRVPTINACSMRVFDLRVMSPTSYQTAPPRVGVVNLYKIAAALGMSLSELFDEVNSEEGSGG